MTSTTRKAIIHGVGEVMLRRGTSPLAEDIQRVVTAIHGNPATYFGRRRNSHTCNGEEYPIHSHLLENNWMIASYFRRMENGLRVPHDRTQRAVRGRVLEQINGRQRASAWVV
ncbi:unnamed protein product, partial [Ectocarpus sp. 12 AP-2014]